MKNKFIWGLLFSVNLAYAQVGIGNNVTTFDDSEILKIVSSNKGVLLPNISIPNLALAAPVASPANSLLVYNTNTTSGKGFYLWQNSKWNPIINSTNVYKYLGIINRINAVSNATVSDSSPNGSNTYAIGELPSAHNWQLIPNLTKNIAIYSPTNNLSINVGGIVQVNAGAATTSNSYAVAIFIDGKLASVRNFIISGSTTCLYNDFNLFMSMNNLTVANHLVEVYETYRVNLAGTSGTSLNFGGKVGTCINLSNVSIDS